MNQTANREQQKTKIGFSGAAFLVALGLVVGLGVACGGRQVSQGATETQTGAKGKILFYRNPMDPKVTSPAPMKDGMGMDYIPVYENEVKQP